MVVDINIHRPSTIQGDNSLNLSQIQRPAAGILDLPGQFQTTSEALAKVRCSTHKLRKSTVAEVTTNYPKVFVQLPLQLKAHLNCKVSSHLFSPKSSGTILSQIKFGTCLGESHGGKVCNVFSHASLSLKLKALHSTKVHCKVKVATEKCFTVSQSVVRRKVVVSTKCRVSLCS